MLDSETVVQLICEQLDIDYNEIKNKLPKQEPNDPYEAMGVLNGEQKTETSPTVPAE